MANNARRWQLPGCQVKPLGDYLKALGVLRIIANQWDDPANPVTRSCWNSQGFILETPMTPDELVDRLLTEYKPFPILSPWNRGGGFIPARGASNKTLHSMLESKAPRFADYRGGIQACGELLAKHFPRTSTLSPEAKYRLLQLCRNQLPEAMLPWLDAAYVLCHGKAQYPPILGTGANDGQAEYSRLFRQRLMELFDLNTGAPKKPQVAERMLRASLFGVSSGCVKTAGTPGQFLPISTGGSTLDALYPATGHANPWDVILMLEGTMLFGAATSRRLLSNTNGVMASPFTVRPSGVDVGGVATSESDTTRCELWLPVWGSLATYAEIRSVFREGRASLQGNAAKPATNSTEFARAIASLGVNRGIDAFQQHGCMQRSGKAYLCVPLRSISAANTSEVESLLHPIHTWLQRLPRGADVPASVRRAKSVFDSKLMRTCQSKDKLSVQELLLSIGQLAAAVRHSPSLWRGANMPISPMPALPVEWLERSYLPAAGYRGVEYRLALSLACIGSKSEDNIGTMRQHFEPLNPATASGGFPQWSDASGRDVFAVSPNVSLVDMMLRILRIRENRAKQLSKQSSNGECYNNSPSRPELCAAKLSDIGAFIRGDVDMDRIKQLLQAMCLIRWRYVPRVQAQSLTNVPGWQMRADPGIAYGLIRLAMTPHRLLGVPIIWASQILRYAAAGQLERAVRTAAARLNGYGFHPLVKSVTGSVEMSRRVAAATLFPISGLKPAHRNSESRNPRVCLSRIKGTAIHVLVSRCLRELPEN